ncbi:MAG TPA: M15 family metallopeptidase [Bacillota bacterium]|nr:M15 family metallopeptidase [Bacillota bacterium]
MIKNFKLSLQIGAVFIGTVVGAGFATGQEIMQFFTCFGQIGAVTLLLSGILFYLMAAAVIRAAAYYNAYNYKELIYQVAGNRIGFVYDILVTAFLFIGTSIMFAGSGALFHESLGLPHTLGVVLMAVLTFIIILHSLTGILNINSVIVPILFAVITAVLAATIMNGDIGGFGLRLSENYDGNFFKPVFYFLFFCSYNTFLSIGVLSAIPEKVKNLSVLKTGVFLGAMGLMLLSLMLNMSLTLKSPQVFNYSIPMDCITSGLGRIIKSVVALCIWCEIFSTAVSNAFSIAKRLSKNRHITYKQTCFFTVLCCLPLAFLEFKGLISFFYPLFGALSMFIIFRLLFASYGFGGKTKKVISLVSILCMITIFAYTANNPQPCFAYIEPVESSYDITMKQDLLCLMMAYPEHIASIEKLEDRVYVTMKSGRKILYDDKKIKGMEAKIAYPDLQDMMEPVYPIGPVKKLMDINYDPGRARVYSLLNEVYGGSRQQIEGNLVNVNTGCGAFQFNRNNKAGEALKNVMDELASAAKSRKEIRACVYPCSGTYNYRVISGTNRLSPHSYGIAIDLARDKRDYWQWASREEGQKRLSSYPNEIVELFERNNFIWGGKWGHFDILHFEYRPEILIKARYFGNSRDIHKPWYNEVLLEDAYAAECIRKIDKALDRN